MKPLAQYITEGAKTNWKYLAHKLKGKTYNNVKTTENTRQIQVVYTDAYGQLAVVMFKEDGLIRVIWETNDYKYAVEGFPYFSDDDNEEWRERIMLETFTEVLRRFVEWVIDCEEMKTTYRSNFFDDFMRDTSYPFGLDGVLTNLTKREKQK